VIDRVKSVVKIPEGRFVHTTTQWKYALSL